MNRPLSAPPPTTKFGGEYSPAVVNCAVGDHPSGKLPTLPVAQTFRMQCDHYRWTLTSDARPLLGQCGSQFDKTLYRLRADYVKQLEASKSVVSCDMYKCLKGTYGLVVQLCPERTREKHSFYSFHRVCERFSAHRSNFVDLRPGETLLQLEDESKATHSIVMTKKVTAIRPLLLPYVGAKLAQAITEDALKVPVEVMLLSECRQFTIAFNSLMAGSEVNQLHFELLNAPYDCALSQRPVERISDALYALKDWIIPGFVVQLSQRNIDAFCKQCAMVTDYLGTLNQPFSLLLCRAKGFQSNEECLLPTAYVFPRLPLSCIQSSRNLRPTGMDMSGVISIHSVDEFQSIGESQIARCFRDFVQIDADAFRRLEGELRKRCDDDRATGGAPTS